MEGIDRKIQRHPQLLRRLTQFAELGPLDLEDLKSVARSVCSTPVDEDLLAHILSKSKGSTGLAVVGLSQVDRFFQGEQKPVKLKDWKSRNEPLFLGSRVA